jgi:hypothetical protein
VDAGYSGTPLPKKLGIKEDSVVMLIDAPAELATTLNTAHRDGLADVIVLFVSSQFDLMRQLDGCIERLADRGGLWIAWPKKASRIPTDIVEQTLRDLILPLGLVDNKVCAIDEVWSGLRFVRRRNLRKNCVRGISDV